LKLDDRGLDVVVQAPVRVGVGVVVDGDLGQERQLVAHLRAVQRPGGNRWLLPETKDRLPGRV
jgi:hypothetical protein